MFGRISEDGHNIGPRCTNVFNALKPLSLSVVVKEFLVQIVFGYPEEIDVLVLE